MNPARHRPVYWYVIFASLLLAIAAAVGTWRTASLFDRIMGASLDRAYLSAMAFAQAAQRWASDEHWETLVYVSNLMMSGGTRGIRIRSDEQVMLDLEASSGVFAALAVSDPLPLDQSDRRLVHTADGWLFEVRAPLDIPNNETLQIHVLMDASPYRSQAAAASIKMWAIAIGAWALASVAILALYRMRYRRSSISNGVSEGTAPLVVCANSKRVRVYGHPIVLTPKQFGLLSLVASKAGRVVTEQEILATVWPDSPYADSNDIRQCVYKIRRRLGNAVPGAGASLVNEKGFGYRLAVDRLPEDALPDRQDRSQEIQEEGDECE